MDILTRELVILTARDDSPGPCDPPPHWQFLACVGSGGFGTVHRARRPDGTEVAVKRIDRASPVWRARARAEFRNLANLRHPCVVRYERFVEKGDQAYLEMEYLDGVPIHRHLTAEATSNLHAHIPSDGVTESSVESLTATISNGLRVPVPEDLDIHLCWLRPAVEGLLHLHAQGLMHGDVKPSNLIRLRNGRVVWIDFGLFRRLGETVLTSDPAGGTIAYSAPELLVTGPSPATDWFGLGRLARRCILGDPGAEPISTTDVPDWLDHLCTLTADAPERRLEAARALAAALGVRPEPLLETHALCVGRDEELDALWAALTRVDDRPASILVSGPSGIGKSAVLRALAGRAAGADHTVVWVTAHPRAETAVPTLDALAEVLARAHRRCLGAQRTPVSASSHALLAHAFPPLAACCCAAPSSEPSRPKEALDLLLDGLSAVLGALQDGGRPVVVVFDDTQWLDPVSARALQKLRARAQGRRALVLLGYRTDSISPQTPLALLDRRVRLHVRLGPLRDPAMHRLLEARRPAKDLSSAQLDAMVAMAEGSPLLGQLLVASNLGEMREGSPLDASRMLLERLHGLQQDALRLAECLSLCAGWTDIRLARAALPQLADLDLAVTHLLTAGWVSRDLDSASERIALAHDRLRETVQTTLTEEAAVALHVALGKAGASTDLLPDGTIGGHLIAGGREEEGAEHLGLAAARAVASGRAAQAVTYIQQAVAALDARALAVPGGLLRALAESYERLDAIPEAIAAWRRLEQEGDPLERLRGERRAAELAFLAGGDTAEAHFQQVCVRNGLRWPRGRLALALSVMMGRLRNLRPWYPDPRALSGSIDLERAETAELWAAASVNFVHRDHLLSLFFHNGYLREAQACRSPLQVSVAYGLDGVLRSLAGDEAGARRWMTLAQEHGRASCADNVDLDVLLQFMSGMVEDAFGSLEQAREILQHALEVQNRHTTLNANCRDMTRHMWLRALHEGGERQRARALLLEVLDETQRSGKRMNHLLLATDYAVTSALLAGDVRDAAALAEQAHATTREDRSAKALEPSALRVKLWVALYQGTEERASAHRTALQRLARSGALHLPVLERARLFDTLVRVDAFRALQGCARARWSASWNALWLPRAPNIRARLYRLNAGATVAALWGRSATAIQRLEDAITLAREHQHHLLAMLLEERLRPGRLEPRLTRALVGPTMEAQLAGRRGVL